MTNQTQNQKQCECLNESCGCSQAGVCVCGETCACDLACSCGSNCTCAAGQCFCSPAPG